MKQNIDLDYDTNLNGDAKGFGISDALIEAQPLAHPPADQETVALSAPSPLVAIATKNNNIIGPEGAVRLAMEVCQWEFTFYAWCDEYLYGVRGEALLDIPLVRYKLRCVRN